MCNLYFHFDSYANQGENKHVLGVIGWSLTILGTDQDGVCRLRGFAHVDGSFSSDSELVLQVSLQACHCVLLPWDILAAGVAAHPSVSWHPHGLHVVADDLAATIILGSGPNKTDRVPGHVQDLWFTWCVCDIKMDKSK